MAGKHLQSFETFIKKGMVTEVGETVTDDEFGCLWTYIVIDNERLDNVNCGQFLANKLLVAYAHKEPVEMSFVKYNNGEKDFNFIAALKSSMGVIADVDFSTDQLRAGAAKMRKTAWIGIWIGVALIATLFIAILGVAVLAGSIFMLRRSKRPLRFAQVLEDASRALN